MFVVSTKLKNQGRFVVGEEFDTLHDAERFLIEEGWERNPCYEGHWMKEESTRRCGLLCIGIMSDIWIEER